MKHYKSKTFAEGYKNLLDKLLNEPEYECSPRDQVIKEITNYHMEIEDPTSCMYTNSRRSSQFKYIAAELVWYFSGSNDLDFIEKYAKFWGKIENGDGTLNSAYGNLLFNPTNHNQWQWAYNSLCKDKDSRQAILHFNTPEHQYYGNKDFVCTMYGIFQIRDNKLNFTISMRSNDVILGLPTDIAFFCLLQQQMLKLLQEGSYPGLELGTYTHIGNSVHVYERHFTMVEDMLDEEFIPRELEMGPTNLVDSTGTMSQEMNLLHHAVRTDINIAFKNEDPLLDWIIGKTLGV